MSRAACVKQCVSINVYQAVCQAVCANYHVSSSITSFTVCQAVYVKQNVSSSIIFLSLCVKQYVLGNMCRAVCVKHVIEQLKPDHMS